MQSDKQVTLESKVQALNKLGVTSMQARIYTLLQISGKLKAKTLTTLSKLPRQDVYKTLSELYEIGLVEKTLTKPFEFKAIPAEKCIHLLVTRRKQNNSEIEATARKIFSSTKKPTIKERDDSSQIVLIPRKEPIFYQATAIFRRAQETISAISPHWKILPWIHKGSRHLDKILARNVQVRFITDTHPDMKQLHKSYRFFSGECCPEIRYLSSVPTASFGLCDRRKLMLDLSSTGGFLESEAIVTENPSLVEMANRYFELLWSQSESPIERQLTP